MQQAKGRLTPRLALQLAAPHTWVASVAPVLLAGILAWRQTGQIALGVWGVLLLIAILMQSAVNTLNDYYDYLRGTDSKDDFVEQNDAVLVYSEVAPVNAKRLGLGFLLAALLLAVVPVQRGGVSVLLAGLAGALVVLGYSAGPFPLSALPMGEIFSGLMMGELMPLACVAVLTRMWRIQTVVLCLPLAIGIGLIMMTNNLCDIERDRAVARHTLPGVMGRERARTLYRVGLLVWGILSVLLCCVTPSKAWKGGIALLCGALALRSLLAQMRLSMIPSDRPRAMAGIVKLNAIGMLAYMIWLIP